jgi:hypothetical protein
MKRFIVIKHDHGTWVQVDAQFDTLESATKYCEMASLGKPGYDFTIYEMVNNYRREGDN